MIIFQLSRWPCQSSTLSQPWLKKKNSLNWLTLWLPSLDQIEPTWLQNEPEPFFLGRLGNDEHESSLSHLILCKTILVLQWLFLDFVIYRKNYSKKNKGVLKRKGREQRKKIPKNLIKKYYKWFREAREIVHQIEKEGMNRIQTS